MMKSSFALAVLASVSAARGNHVDTSGLGKLGNDQKFNDHAAKFNVNIRNVSDYSTRQGIYRQNDQIIEAQNAKSAASGKKNALKLAHNQTSTMTQDELNALMGLDSRQASQASTTLTLGDSSRHGGKRHLMEVAKNVDHFDDGYMHSVKNQGSCGSCWAFAANTALEGTLAKKTNTSPVRISEQQLVDCTYTLDPDNEAQFGKDYKDYGCQGGWMSWAWDF